MRRKCVDNYSGPTTLGIDVSVYQDNIKWDKISKNVKFVISRTGDGRSIDTQFKRNWEETGKLGLIRGSYQFFRADRDGKSQAEKIIKQIDQAGGLKKTDLTPAIDIEEGTKRNLSGGVFEGEGTNMPIDLVVEECLEFLQVLEDYYKARPIVYGGNAIHWWLSQGRPDLAEKFAKYPLWLPSYTSRPLMPVDKNGKGFPWTQWKIWQYSSKGKISGITGDVDVNKFRGTEEDLKKFVKSLRLNTKSDDQKIKELLLEGKELADKLHDVFEKLRIKLFV